VFFVVFGGIPFVISVSFLSPVALKFGRMSLCLAWVLKLRKVWGCSSREQLSGGSGCLLLGSFCFGGSGAFFF